MKEDAVKGLENIEKLIKVYGKNGHSVCVYISIKWLSTWFVLIDYSIAFKVGDSLTWADLFIHEITYCLLNHQEDLFNKFAAIKQVRENVESNPNIASYLKNRPLTPF